MNDKLNAEDHARLNEFSSLIAGLREKLGTQIVGQEEIVTQVMAAILSEGHCLIIGVPGLAKTLLVRSIAELLTLDFSRIQFTPDLMPSDIIGASLLQDDQAGNRGFHFLRGPIFSNVILADEINRTPPKTQAALMEAMEERQVTAAGENLTLERPFFVLATQNPIEQEGTYPLPVSQLDRFQQSIQIDYPDEGEEFEIVQQTTSSYQCSLEPLLERAVIVEMISLAGRIVIPSELLDYVSALVRSTRPDSDDAPEFVKEWISWGAGPRGIQAILAAARSMALMGGRAEINADDVHKAAFPALRHRMVPTYHAEAEGVSCDDIIEKVLLGLPGGRYRPETQQAENRPGFFQRLLGRN